MSAPRSSKLISFTLFLTAIKSASADCNQWNKDMDAADALFDKTLASGVKDEKARNAQLDKWMNAEEDSTSKKSEMDRCILYGIGRSCKKESDSYLKSSKNASEQKSIFKKLDNTYAASRDRVNLVKQRQELIRQQQPWFCSRTSNRHR